MRRGEIGLRADQDLFAPDRVALDLDVDVACGDVVEQLRKGRLHAASSVGDPAALERTLGVAGEKGDRVGDAFEFGPSHGTLPFWRPVWLVLF